MSLTRFTARAIGTILIGGGVIAGVLLWIFYLLVLVDWMGAIGFVVAVVAAPGVVVFPIIFWVVEGSPPFAYFGYLAAAIMLPLLGTGLRQD
jgi:hypothetical protein